MMKNIFVYVLITTSLLSGCSANMAMNGQNGPDIKVVKQQTTRQNIELMLGSPIETSSLKNGHVICWYQFEGDIDPDYLKAVGYAAADLFTFGLWEAIGSPIEGYKGRKRKAVVEYDLQNSVIGFALNS